tara:strand:- start:1001 stop:1675 length:675 start_codon:yes stop_codon:yes gene_type:complete
MGVVIFTRDAARYREGNYVEDHRGLATPPTAPDTTFIVHDNKMTEKKASEWADVVPFRMVIVTEKAVNLKGNDERVFADNTVSNRKQSYRRNVESIFRWTDRDRVHSILDGTPLPLITSFLRVNCPEDIETARRLAQVRYQLPDQYSYSVLAFSIKPRAGKVVWPSKRPASKPEGRSIPFIRASDNYVTDLLALNPRLRNEVREKSDSLPKGVKKTKESVGEWL